MMTNDEYFCAVVENTQMRVKRTKLTNLKF